ncbi:unnamed protein product [Cyclocybe aegerita]|uniref:F-box domain-containing protein n=1 Tax=Cyclocybe aegerita TaxID=1973307 RepID=A0A8S0WBZ3_CYCAE|nr:unnamed protein product [Cyclocybe aegerita]
MCDGPIIDSTTLVPPVPRVLVSNDEPTAEEHALIVQAIKAAEEQMHVRQSIPASKKDYRRDGELIAFVRSHKGVVSAFRRLATELLCVIFTHFANDPRPNLDHPPYRLGHVCRRWRSVILSLSPAIYTVTMPIQITKHHSKLGLNHRLRLVLEQVPLYSCKLSNVYDSRHPIMVWFLVRSRRWKTASLTIDPRSSVAVSLFDPLKVPNLQSLRLCFMSPPPLARAIRSCDAFKDAPSLHEVEVEALTPPFELKIPWHQLTKYKERSARPFGFPSLIQNEKGARLEDLTYIALESSSVAGKICATVLHRLTRLDIRLYHEKSIPFLEQLRAPNLQELRVRDMGHPELLRDIRSLLWRPRSFESKLTRLAIYTKPFAPSKLSHFLRLVPHVVELECNDIPLEDLAEMTMPADKTAFVPQEPPLIAELRRLTIYSPSKLALSAIDRLIDSRLKVTPGAPHVPFDVVRLVFPDEVCCDEAASVFDVARADDQDSFQALSKHLSELDALMESYKLDAEPGIFQAVSDWMAARKLDSVLTAMEQTPLNDPKLIEVRALNILKKFWHLDSHRIPLESSYDFLRRARFLLDVWTAAFRDRPTGHRWVRHGLRSLLYVRDAGGEGWHDQFVHGEYSTVNDPAFFWPYQDV